MNHILEFIPGIKKAIDTNLSISKRALKNQFDKLILQPLSKITLVHPRLLESVVIIDAFEECDRGEDIQLILRLFART